MRLTDFLTDIGPSFSYYPQLAKVLGGVKEAVFVCRIIKWQTEKIVVGNWVTRSMAEITLATGLSGKEQRRVRWNLRGLGVLEEMELKLMHQIKYRINTDSLVQIFKECGVHP